MNKQDIYKLLSDESIWYEVTEHQAVFNMDELAQIDIPYPKADAKNLFVRDDKKENYYLITVRGDKRVDLKAFRREHQTRPLSFGTEIELENFMDLKPGSVTPFGLLNDKNRKVKFYLDSFFLEAPGIIGVHPNDNTATVWIKTVELLDIIKKHSTEVEVVKMN